MSYLYIYQASAGSGKTHRLVIEYLTLALAFPKNYKNTLAITFTNKATDEMKSRVIEYLADLCNDDKSDLALDIMKNLNSRFKTGRDFTLKNRASEVLSNILHDYSNFHISTIDSFCIRVIRSFAKELGLQIGFDIELDTKKVLAEITQKFLDKFSSDENIAKYFEQFLIYKLGEGFTWNIEEDIKEIGMEIFSEEYWQRRFSAVSGDVYENRESTLEHIKEIQQVKYSFENYLKSKASETLELIEKKGLADNEYFSRKSQGAYNEMLKLKNGKKEVSKILINLVAEGKDILKISHPASGALNQAVYEIVHFYVSALPAYKTANAVARNIYNIGIFSDLLSLLNNYRRDNRVLLTTDINNILRKLISDDISPFIYEKTGARIKNILIDEFQDTSRFQWNNLKPLVVNSLSEKNTALLVGDVKQSIYRWRGGDMRILLEDVEKDLAGFRDVIKKEKLTDNFRSHKEIVEFNNLFFEKFAEKISKRNLSGQFVKESYEINSLKQSPLPDKKFGFVNINFFPYNKDNELKSYEESDLKVKNILEELQHDDYTLSDILVLVRTKDDSLQISGFLSSLGYSVVSELSLLVDSSPKVKLLLSLMRFISDNKNELAKTEALNHYLNIAGKEIDFRKIFEDKSFFRNIFPSDFFRDDQKTGFKSVLNELTAYELAEHLIEIFGLSDKADPYLMGFLNETYVFSKKSEDDISSFLEYWDSVREDLTVEIPENAGGIRVMTIHKAKGLQAKVVIIPYADWDIDVNFRKTNFWASAGFEPFNKAPAYYIKYSNELEDSYFKNDAQTELALTNLDNTNLLYVSFTRPEERLYVNVPFKRNSSIANIVHEVVSENFRPDEDNPNSYSLGAKLKKGDLNDEKRKQKRKKVEISHEEIGGMVSSAWYKKIVIRSSYRKLKVFDEKFKTVKTNKGIVIHQLLSYMKYADDAPGAINQALFEGIISESEKDFFKELLESVLDNPSIKEWYHPEWTVMNETEILTADGKIARPDRVITNGNETVIIDYKTGRERDEDIAQLNGYAALLNDMGYDNIRKFLIHISDSDKELIKVKEV